VKQGVQHGSINTPTTSVPGPEARHDPRNLFPMIPMLTDSADIDAAPSTKIYKALSSILLLLLLLWFRLVVDIQRMDRVK